MNEVRAKPRSIEGRHEKDQVKPVAKPAELRPLATRVHSAVSPADFSV